MKQIDSSAKVPVREINDRRTGHVIQTASDGEADGDSVVFGQSVGIRGFEGFGGSGAGYVPFRLGSASRMGNTGTAITAGTINLNSTPNQSTCIRAGRR